MDLLEAQAQSKGIDTYSHLWAFMAT